MKNLKQLVVIVGLTLLFNYSKAQNNWTINNGDSYYMCAGQGYNLNLNIPAGSVISGSNQWSWNGSTYTGNDNYLDNIEVQDWSNGYWTATINCLSTSTGSIPVTVTYIYNFTPYNISFTLYTYYVTINSTGGDVCTSGSPFTYTSTTNAGSTYSWTAPSCWSTSNSTASSVTYSVTTSCEGNLVLNVSGSGCPTGSASNSASVPVASSVSGTPPAPGGSLVFEQNGHTCEFNANIPYDNYATKYEWALNSSFSPVLETTTTPSTTNGDFNASTNYNVYVRIQDACSSTTWGTATSWNKTTPSKPPGCINAAIRPDVQSVSSEDFKLYPNPAGNTINIEYPSISDNSSEMTCTIYDMLGDKISSWSLSAYDNKVTENSSGMKPGLYLYVISSGDNILSRGKIMIQR